MRGLLRFIRGYRSFNRMIATTDPVLLQQFRQLSGRIVDREAYLLDLADAKRVLHFGFLDSIFLEQKITDNSLLHTRLGRRATRLCGVDIDGPVLQRYRHLTNDCDNLLWDIADGCIPDQLRQGFDLVLFPEVLEHVPDPALVLGNLCSLCRLNSARLCLTVPNAFDMYGFMAAMHGIEVVHPDHLHTFTPHTLTGLLRVAGLQLLDLSFYNFGSTLAPGLTKAGLVALCEPADIG